MRARVARIQQVCQSLRLRAPRVGARGRALWDARPAPVEHGDVSSSRPLVDVDPVDFEDGCLQPARHVVAPCTGGTRRYAPNAKIPCRMTLPPFVVRDVALAAEIAPGGMRIGGRRSSRRRSPGRSPFFPLDLCMVGGLG